MDMRETEIAWRSSCPISSPFSSFSLSRNVLIPAFERTA